MPTFDPEALFASADRMATDPDAELSLSALNGDAIRTLQDVLLNAPSDDVKRKAAVDILNFNKSKSSDKPTVTEAQLEYLGRIIVETETVRLGIIGGEDSPRVLESIS